MIQYGLVAEAKDGVDVCDAIAMGGAMPMMTKRKSRKIGLNEGFMEKINLH